MQLAECVPTCLLWNADGHPSIGHQAKSRQLRQKTPLCKLKFKSFFSL